MDKRRHSPQRSCLGCGAREDRSRLIRIRLGTRGDLIADDSNLGRGGYLHRAVECWDRFTRRKSSFRAFRMEIGKTAKEKLVKELKERYGE